MKVSGIWPKVLVLIIVAPVLSFYFLTVSMPHGQSLNYEDSVNGQNLSYVVSKKAVIIDQLDDELPNKHFQEKFTEYLEMAGYDVDLFTTKDITMEFYKKLPSMGYKFIIVRTHAAVNDDPANSIAIFTGEKYQTDKYIFEQISGQVLKATAQLFLRFEVKAGESSTLTNANESQEYYTPTGTSNTVVNEEEPYFAIGSKFVDELMIGKFPDSIIILGGCDTLANPSLADSLLRRGASAVIGWDTVVGHYHNDMVVLSLLEHLLVDKADIKNSVDSAMQIFENSNLSAILKYYPESAGMAHL